MLGWAHNHIVALSGYGSFRGGFVNTGIVKQWFPFPSLPLSWRFQKWTDIFIIETSRGKAKLRCILVVGVHSRTELKNFTFLQKSIFSSWIHFDHIFSRNHRGCLFSENPTENCIFKKRFTSPLERTCNQKDRVLNSKEDSIL